MERFSPSGDPGMIGNEMLGDDGHGEHGGAGQSKVDQSLVGGEMSGENEGPRDWILRR